MEQRVDHLLATDYIDMRLIHLAADAFGVSVEVLPRRGRLGELALDAYGQAAAYGAYELARGYAEIVIYAGGAVVQITTESSVDGTKGPWFDFHQTLGEARMKRADQIVENARMHNDRAIKLIGLHTTRS